MKVDNLKTIIKQAVREAIQEELKDILLEAVRSPKAATGFGTVTENVAPQVDTAEVRSRYSEIMGGYAPGQSEMSFTSANVHQFGAQGYNPPRTVNTTGEGSALPAGEVSLDQLMGLMSKK